MKKIFHTTYITGLLLAFSACDKAMIDNFPTEYASVVHFKHPLGQDVVEVKLLNTGEDGNAIIPIGKGGNNPSASASVNIELLALEELEEYNANFNTTYKILDSKYYSLSSQNIAFAAKESQKELTITFHTQEMANDLIASDQYVIPLRLKVQSGKVNNDFDRLIIKPSITTPVVTLDIPPVQQITMSIFDEQPAAFNSTISSYVDLPENKWNFSVNFEQDDATLSSLVDQYNNNGTNRNFKLLPKSNYSIPSTLQFATGKLLVSENLKIERKDLPVGNYLLPIKFKSVTGVPFKPDAKVAYIEIAVNNLLPQIALKKEMLGGTRDERGPNFGEKPRLKEYLIDGDKTTYWQTEWTVFTTPGDNNKPHDPKYGLYLDVALESEIKNMSFDILAFNQKLANPVHVQVYVGNDINSLSPLPIMDLGTGFPTDGSETWFKSPQYKGVKNFKYIRFAFIKNGEGKDLRQKLNSSVIVSELKIYGN